jgi:hypothetical protein
MQEVRHTEWLTRWPYRMSPRQSGSKRNRWLAHSTAVKDKGPYCDPPCGNPFDNVDVIAEETPRPMTYTFL